MGGRYIKFWGIQEQEPLSNRERYQEKRREKRAVWKRKGEEGSRLVKIGEKEQSGEEEKALGRNGRGEVQMKG